MNKRSQARFLRDAGMVISAIARFLEVAEVTAWRWVSVSRGNNPEREREHRRTHYQRSTGTLVGRIGNCLKACKKHARRKGFAPCNTPAEVIAAALIAQDYRCAICGGRDDVRRLAMDHNHVAGEFRGWLCRRCNHLLGLAEDNPALLKAAMRYLEEAEAESRARGIAGEANN